MSTWIAIRTNYKSRNRQENHTHRRCQAKYRLTICSQLQWYVCKTIIRLYYFPQVIVGQSRASASAPHSAPVGFCYPFGAREKRLAIAETELFNRLKVHNERRYFNLIYICHVHSLFVDKAARGESIYDLLFNLACLFVVRSILVTSLRPTSSGRIHLKFGT